MVFRPYICLVVVSALLLFAGVIGPLSAQSADATARLAEWESYRLPEIEFRRYVEPTGRLFFRVPADWQQAGTASKFAGPTGVELTAFVETIPDGYTIKAYFAAVLQHFQSIPGAADLIKIRPVEFAGLEGREAMIGLLDNQGNVSRRVIWCAVEGATAIGLVFICPDASAATFEPVFKAIAQSTLLAESKAGYEMHADRLKETGMTREKARIDQIQAIVSNLEASAEARQKASEELAGLLKSDPDTCLDLFLDRRGLVRGALFDAIAVSRSEKLAALVFDALEDPSAWVAEKAARCLASLPGAMETIRKESMGWSIDTLHILRVAPYLKAQDRAEAIGHLLETTKNTFKKGERSLAYEAAIQLMEALSPADYRAPVKDLIAMGDAEVIRLAVEAAIVRKERLESDLLLGLLSNSDKRVAVLAAAALVNAAGQGIEKKLAERIAKLEKAAKRSDTESAVLSELKQTRRKRELARKLEQVSGEQRRALLLETLKDAEIGNWVWREFGSQLETNLSPDDIRRAAPVVERGAQQAGEFGENMLPERVALYTAIPDPGEAFSRLESLLNGVKMHSTRDQATFALMMSAYKELLAKGLGIQSNKCDFISQGILPHAPAAFATWKPEAAPASVSTSRRSAVILGVSDRDRFEQLLASVQQKKEDLAAVPSGVAAIARMIGLFPAIAPGLAQAALLEPTPEAKGREKAEAEKGEMVYTTLHSDVCGSLPIKVFERRKSTLKGMEKPERAYLAYVGDKALITFDLDSLRDLLARLHSGKQLLKENAQFQALRKLKGEAIYLSEFDELDRKPATGEAKEEDSDNRERGRLVIYPDRIENEYHLSFKDETGEQPFLPFKPADLGAPEKLLPASTVVFFFMHANEIGRWPKELKKLLGQADLLDLQKAFQANLEKDIFPELGPECGAALVDVISVGKNFRIPWVVFFALRTNKLIETHEKGKLFDGVKGDDGSTRVKMKGVELNATIKQGYLVLAADPLTLKKLEDPKCLKDTVEYQRSAAAVSQPVVAFGGVNALAGVRPADPNADVRTARAVNALTSLARAFHSHTFLGQLDGNTAADFKMSVSTDREGAYSVADLATPASDFDLAFAVVRAGGVPVIDTAGTNAIRLQIRAKGRQVDERLAKELQSPHQKLEGETEDALTLTVRRRAKNEQLVASLPVSGPEFAADLGSTREIRPDDPQIQAKAREIVGNEKDAWKVACKLSDWVFSNLKWKLVEHRDSTETLAAKEADCLEFSQLYIAMARTLGLPARLVTGLAWSGGSFIGHAWVEVFAGEWVELDPTFGTYCVDAFHVRETSGQLLTLGALNALQIEVLEALRDIPESQKDARALIGDLCPELHDNGKKSVILSALDPALLVSEHLAPLSWADLSHDQRSIFLSAYQTVIAELTSFDKDAEFRILAVEEHGDRAKGYVMQNSEHLLILQLRKHNGLWNLVELVQSDAANHLVAETLQPYLDVIRSGISPTAGKAAGRRYSPYTQVLLKVSADPAGAVSLADQVLLKQPGLNSVAVLKALALARLEKRAESVAVLESICQKEPHPAALLQLARLHQLEEPDWEQAAEMYRQYGEAVTVDPRPHSARAYLFDSHEKPAEAETEYREAIKRDPNNWGLSLNLVEFLAKAGRYREAASEIDRGADDESRKQRFEDVLIRLYQDPETADGFAAVEAARLVGNATANLHLSRIRLFAGKAKEALAPAREAVKLSPDDAFAHVTLAEVLRKLGKTEEARKSCEQSLKIDPEDPSAHYEMACILAKLGKKREALDSLKKALEGDDDLGYDVPEEEDLKSLADVPEFKELMKPYAEELTDESAEPQEQATPATAPL